MQRKKLVFLIAIVAFALALGLSYLATPSPRAIAFSAPAIGEEGKGTLVAFKLSIVPGSGRTLVNVENTGFRGDVEAALRKAKAQAQLLSGTSLSSYDIILDVESGQSLSEVSGESAGAMFGVSLVALIEGRRIREDASMSAALSEDGALGPVGGIEEKIIAAKASGKKAFVASARQEIKFEHELSNGIQIVRAPTLADAVKAMLEN